MFLSPLGERLGEGVLDDCLLHHPLTQPLPQGGEEHESVRATPCAQEIFSNTGRMYSRNFAGCSLIGKWPTCFMICTSTPGICAAVRSVSSAVQEKSYSPVSR